MRRETNNKYCDKKNHDFIHKSKKTTRNSQICMFFLIIILFSNSEIFHSYFESIVKYYCVYHCRYVPEILVGMQPPETSLQQCVRLWDRVGENIAHIKLCYKQKQGFQKWSDLSCESWNHSIKLNFYFNIILIFL